MTDSTSDLIGTIREIFPQLSPGDREELFLAIDQLRLEALLSDASDPSDPSDPPAIDI